MAQSVLGARALTTPTPDERRVMEAIKAVLLPMLEREPQAVSFGALAKVAIEAMADVPRVPNFTGPRMLDGPNALNDHEPITIGIDAREDDGEGVVLIGAQLGDDQTGRSGAMALGPAEARVWLLAGLAACAAAEGDHAAELPPLRAQDPAPDCATTLAPVTLTGTAAERAAIEANAKDVT